MPQVSLSIDGELAKLIHRSGHAAHFQYPDLFLAARSLFPRFMQAWCSSTFSRSPDKEEENALK